MIKDYIFWIFTLSIVTGVIILSLWPFILGAIMLFVLFGAIYSGISLMHRIMHKLHFCLLCGVYPISKQKHIGF